MTATVEHTTQVIGGKEYPVTITRQKGFQELMIHGRLTAVESVTIFESPLGCSRCYTRTVSKGDPEDEARTLAAVRETAVQAMIDQGIW